MIGGNVMFWGKDLGGFGQYKKLKIDDFSVNEKYWEKYQGISGKLSYELPKDNIYELVNDYVCWILGDSSAEEMDEKIKKLPDIIRNTYLVYTYEGEINNGGGPILF